MKYFLFIVVCVLPFCDLSYSDTKKKPDHFYIRVRVTAYCPCEKCCGKYADGKTATGRNAYKPGVAVDPKVISLGSRLDIPGYHNWVLADDVGGAIKGKHVDVRLKNHKKALTWARSHQDYMTIRVWQTNKGGE